MALALVKILLLVFISETKIDLTQKKVKSPRCSLLSKDGLAASGANLFFKSWVSLGKRGKTENNVQFILSHYRYMRRKFHCSLPIITDFQSCPCLHGAYKLQALFCFKCIK